MASAEDYDDLVNYASLPAETEAEVAALARLARGGRVLELGVGTGRVAIPLAGMGLEVHGIELDPAMAEQLRNKTGGELVRMHLGDMAEVEVEGSFDLVYAVFGTFFALLTQDAQVRCFRNIAARLSSGGRFVIEALMPQPGTYTERRKVTVAAASDERVIINVSELDPLAQTIHTHQVVLGQDKVDIVPVHIRYSWPSELDLMAQLAGLQLVERWANWQQEPFTVAHPRHISIYSPRRRLDRKR
ncbi:MAG: class I SAM-dependent methyltransferase [Actinomycetota bacterium]|nr:class I SAM-dependent methyltransferase [Actinomycetota bacterium]